MAPHIIGQGQATDSEAVIATQAFLSRNTTQQEPAKNPGRGIGVLGALKSFKSAVNTSLKPSATTAKSPSTTLAPQNVPDPKNQNSVANTKRSHSTETARLVDSSHRTLIAQKDVNFNQKKTQRILCEDDGKENSQESSIPVTSERNSTNEMTRSNLDAHPKGESEVTLWEGRKRMPRQFVQVAKDQLALLERGDSWWAEETQIDRYVNKLPASVITSLPSRKNITDCAVIQTGSIRDNETRSATNKQSTVSGSLAGEAVLQPVAFTQCEDEDDTDETSESELEKTQSWASSPNREEGISGIAQAAKLEGPSSPSTAQTFRRNLPSNANSAQSNRISQRQPPSSCDNADVSPSSGISSQQHRVDRDQSSITSPQSNRKRTTPVRTQAVPSSPGEMESAVPLGLDEYGSNSSLPSGPPSRSPRRRLFNGGLNSLGMQVAMTPRKTSYDQISPVARGRAGELGRNSQITSSSDVVIPGTMESYRPQVSASQTNSTSRFMPAKDQRSEKLRYELRGSGFIPQRTTSSSILVEPSLAAASAEGSEEDDGVDEEMEGDDVDEDEEEVNADEQIEDERAEGKAEDYSADKGAENGSTEEGSEDDEIAEDDSGTGMEKDDIADEIESNPPISDTNRQKHQHSRRNTVIPATPANRSSQEYPRAPEQIHRSPLSHFSSRNLTQNVSVDSSRGLHKVPVSSSLEFTQSDSQPVDTAELLRSHRRACIDSIRSHEGSRLGANLAQSEQQLPEKEAKLSLYEKFCDTYPAFQASRRNFAKACFYLKWLKDEKRAAPHPSLWDDFVRAFCDEYLKYVRECALSKTKPVPCIEYYNEFITPHPDFQAGGTIKLEEVQQFLLLEPVETGKWRQKFGGSSQGRSARPSLESVHAERSSPLQVSPDSALNHFHNPNLSVDRPHDDLMSQEVTSQNDETEDVRILTINKSVESSDRPGGSISSESRGSPLRLPSAPLLKAPFFETHSQIHAASDAKSAAEMATLLPPAEVERSEVGSEQLKDPPLETEKPLSPSFQSPKVASYGNNTRNESVSRSLLPARDILMPTYASLSKEINNDSPTSQTSIARLSASIPSADTEIDMDGEEEDLASTRARGSPILGRRIITPSNRQNTTEPLRKMHGEGRRSIGSLDIDLSNSDERRGSINLSKTAPAKRKSSNTFDRPAKRVSWAEFAKNYIPTRKI